jgi:hypothetical protein
LQRALLLEHEAQFDELYAKIYATFVGAAAGDGRDTLLNQVQDVLSSAFNRAFPYNKPAGSSADKTKSDIAALQKFMSAYSTSKGAKNEPSR